MPQTEIPAAAFADTKPHYDLLDGLRGVAALTVVCFHLFEAYATSHLDQKINHGYLAVDFFFILSGFVVGYAYDDRWEKMTVGDFFKRRLIRLQPMVVIGALIGAVMFYFQGCPVWDVSKISVTMLLVATLMNALLIPATPGSEIRGVGEMYPLNGPSWSLFFEYIGNILYALFLRRLPTRALAALVLLAGCGLTAFAVWGPLGDICVGFALTEENIVGGSLRLLFSFSAGLLMSRVFKPVRVRGAFWIGALGVVAVSAVLSMPATGAIIQSVSQTPGAIGYVGLAYLNPEVKALAVSYDGGGSYVAPTFDNARSKSYPIVRPLYFYYTKSNEAAVRPLVDYLTSDEGQAMVASIGFIPIR